LPTPCPSRLKELIALANLEPDSEVRKHLKAIAEAFRTKRRRQNATSSIDIPSPFQIRIDLENGALTGVYDELAVALQQVESESNVDRIRQCPICSEIFWAGRADKEACARHAVRWRKQEWRREEKKRIAEREKRHAQRVRRQIQKPFELSRTTAAILDAVELEQKRRFKTIDDYCYLHLRAWGRHTGMYRTVNVTRGLKKLEELGYIHCYRPEDDKDAKPYYTPTTKLKLFRKALLAGTKYTLLETWVKDRDEPPTH
jgi:DNA-binding MarR family transcriptional regulator